MQWLSLFLSALSWWTWWGQSMAHGSTDLQRKRGARWEKWMQIFRLWSNKSTRNIILYWAIILIHNKGGLMVCVQCHWNVWFPQYGKSELSLWVCVCLCAQMWYSQFEGSGRCSRRKGTRSLCRPQREERTIWGNKKAQPEGSRAGSFREGREETTTTTTTTSVDEHVSPLECETLSHSLNNYQSLWCKRPFIT